MNNKTVLVVEDHPLFSKALVGLLREMEACREVLAAGSAEEGLARLRASQPDLIVLDLGLPGVAGVDAITLFRRACAAPIVVVSASEQRQAVNAALRAGAAAVVSKSVALDTLQDILRQVLAGTWSEPKWIRPAGSLSLVEENPHGMTPRQQEIAVLLLKGHSNKEIAARLGISQRTVENHRAAVMKRTKTKSLPDLIRLVMRAG